ncbi:four-helix bundle copper-binding protein [Pseudomonas subflava]|uniref:four-helix bundle copper-binding protein n=1 Tax=Pseudomonas subflava TaxID=2952933 RepID=UPI00207A296B|nr:four-helix bundle copper-binding protein [Pseudomonas subflava]HSX70155.1 four-helix bundle copper-binding protein [Pseudomonas sp.]
MVRERYASCIQACSACAIACETCAAACLKEPDVQHMATCISCDIDCADLCRLAVRLMARDSPLADEICRLCALACQACAEACGEHQHDHCQQCAQACQRCVEECEAMAAGA